ncbi:hypothetical protein [Pedobacter montanisoli]|uniref:Gliding motility protein GldL n=1 Tax=Pedobacter montanisoli TaxID=2923277 RepID=A0ABS9ZRQ4_9SPHI|nr:hypothetical protein [Pedobacter montanisoli]MCJ0741198.1 hypothetical protein [Pedobacter montanisoli]
MDKLFKIGVGLMAAAVLLFPVKLFAEPALGNFILFFCFGAELIGLLLVLISVVKRNKQQNDQETKIK